MLCGTTAGKPGYLDAQVADHGWSAALWVRGCSAEGLKAAAISMALDEVVDLRLVQAVEPKMEEPVGGESDVRRVSVNPGRDPESAVRKFVLKSAYLVRDLPSCVVAADLVEAVEQHERVSHPQRRFEEYSV